MKVRKLGKKQKEILQLMNNGWELGLSLGITPRWWIQERGLGKGGKAIQNLSSSTCRSLLGHNYIRLTNRNYPNQHYGLTELGKQALNNN